MSANRRRWLELRARSADAGELEPLLAEGLLALGARAVQERDGWFVAHVEEPEDARSFLAGLTASLSRLVGGAEVDVATSWVPHEEWAEAWKRGLAPRRLTPRLQVTTSWLPVEAGPGEVVVVVDPGMAFGNAEHGTTRGCLRLLDRVVKPGDRVLDVGAGSGILAVSAALLGAGEVLALEGDPLATDALAQNVARNGVADRVRWEIRWADGASLSEGEAWSGLMANIESGTLRPMLAGFAAAVAPAGWLILSGILAEEWAEMSRDVERAGFTLVATDDDGEWRSGLFRR